MENMRKKQHNPLGRYNWLVPSTDTKKFWHISLENESTPDSQIRIVWTCCDGWLLISRREEIESRISWRFSIWNPESLEVINMPPLILKPKQFITAATLLSAPSKPGCVVMLFEGYFRYIIYCRLHNKQWIMRWLGKQITEIGHNDAKDKIFQNYISHCEGKLFAATLRSSYLMEIEEKKSKNIRLRPLNFKFPKTFSHGILSNKKLLDFCGQLCVVEVTQGGIKFEDIIDVDVFKLELSGNRMEWVTVDCAEDQAFFLSDHYSFSCPVNELEIKGGCIYLFENKRFYSINIKDKSFSASLPSQKLSKSKKLSFLSIRDIVRLFNPQSKPKNPIRKFEAQNGGIVIEDNNGARTSNLFDLPFDILGFIAKKLYFNDYINFRSICQTFRRVAPHQKKWSEASFKSQFSSLSPWLVFPDSCTTHNFISSHFGGKYLITIPESGKLRYSKGSWLLICSPTSMFFYHPFTKKLISLPLPPPLPQGVRLHNRCWSYALSSSPTSTDSILVGHNDDSIYYFYLQREEWFEYGTYGFSFNHNSPIYFDEAFYFLSGNGKIGVFDLNVDGQVSWKILNELHSPCDNCCYNSLLECDGKLLSIFVVDQLVYIFKLNCNTAVVTWEKVTSLENHALFVSRSSSFSVVPNSSDMGNKVYFHKLYGMNIVYYCLSTEKFYTCGNKEVVEDFYNTTEYLFSTWIEPSWDV